jgi:hypothetical protein
MSLPELTIRTRSAHWGWDEHRYFGLRVFEELTGNESMTGLMALSIIGRRLPADCCGVLDDAAAALTLADPRIWPLKLTRVVAAYQSPIPALCAGMLLENEARIGPWAFLEASRVLLELHTAIAEAAGDVDGVVNAYLTQHSFVWGFGTPFRGRDERLVAFRRSMQKRGRDVLPYWRTMETVAAAVTQAKKAEPNMGIAVAAALLDMGLEPQEILLLVVALMQHMFFAHALDGTRSDAVALRELPVDYVKYDGRPPRLSPRAKQAELTDAGANWTESSTP